MRRITSQPRILLALVVCLGSLAIWMKLSRYPSRAEVSRTLDQIPALGAARRSRVLTELVDRLRFSESARDEEVMSHALSTLGFLYRTEHYPEILEALDRTQLHGDRFRSEVCAVYAQLTDDAELRRRYRADSRALRRCIGFGLSTGDLAQLSRSEP